MTEEKYTLEEAIDKISYMPSHKKRELFEKTRFQGHFDTISKELAALEEPEDPIETYSCRADNAMHYTSEIFYRITGHSPDNSIHAYAKHCGRAGRKEKYSRDDKYFHCAFIEILTNRGASERQSMILLSKLRNEEATSPTGFIRGLKSIYKAYKNSDDFGMHSQKNLDEDAYYISKMLELDGGRPLESSEKKFEDALNAFKGIWQDVIDLMKENHELLKKHDPGYPNAFGDIIELVEVEYDNPLNYFYKHQISSEKSGRTRASMNEKKRHLREYIHSVFVYRDEKKLVVK